MDEIVARCIHCYSEFTEDEIRGANCCPKCGLDSVPMNPKDDVAIKINWHELRILTIWATNYARRRGKI